MPLPPGAAACDTIRRALRWTRRIRFELGADGSRVRAGEAGRQRFGPRWPTFQRKEGSPSDPSPWEISAGRRPALRGIAVADRIPPLAAERAARDLRTRRGLVALPLAHPHQAQHAVDRGGVEARTHDLVARLLQVDVAAQDR